MLQVCIIILVGWYLLIFGVSAERTNGQNNLTNVTLLDKQHDYQINFERLELFRYDKLYIKSINVVTFKYNRTCAVVNATHMYTLDVGNDLEIVAQVYRFASNEYRTFPIRIQINFCQAVNKNVMGIADFRKCGTFAGCPLVKNRHYSICNWAPNPAKFPPFIPSGQYMVEFQVVYRSMELFVLRGYGTIFRPIPVSN